MIMVQLLLQKERRWLLKIPHQKKCQLNRLSMKNLQLRLLQ